MTNLYLDKNLDFHISWSDLMFMSTCRHRCEFTFPNIVRIMQLQTVRALELNLTSRQTLRRLCNWILWILCQNRAKNVIILHKTCHIYYSIMIKQQSNWNSSCLRYFCFGQQVHSRLCGRCRRQPLSSGLNDNLLIITKNNRLYSLSSAQCKVNYCESLYFVKSVKFFLLVMNFFFQTAKTDYKF